MDKAFPDLCDGLQPDFAELEQQIDWNVTSFQKEGARRALAVLDATARTADPEVAKKTVSRFLERCTATQPLPPLIDHFVETHLRPYLTRLYLVEGELGPNWPNACKYTQHLVWSLLPKQDQESRKQFFALLPELFQWLHMLLRSQWVDDSEEDAFFVGLAKLHAAALQRKKRPTPVSRSGETIQLFPSVVTRESERDTRDLYEEDASSGDRHGLQPGEEPPAIGTGKHNSDPLSDMRVGTCVEFANECTSKQTMRLMWMNKRGSVFLFQDDSTDETITVTASRLNHLIREQSACAVS